MCLGMSWIQLRWYLSKFFKGYVHLETGLWPRACLLAKIIKFGLVWRSEDRTDSSQSLDRGWIWFAVRWLNSAWNALSFCSLSGYHSVYRYGFLTLTHLSWKKQMNRPLPFSPPVSRSFISLYIELILSPTLMDLLMYRVKWLYTLYSDCRHR